MPKIEIVEVDSDADANTDANTDANEVVYPSNTKGAHNHNKVILLLMIKNESRIIQRCIEAAIEHVDAVAILDTGSTDNTVEVCTEVLTKIGKPFKISVEPFKNFGHNRSVSFLKAQELCGELKWDAEKTYALAVDADMNIVVSSAFKDFELKENGYTVIQQNGHLKYYNTRLMKCSHPWKCVGATHEYWSGDPTQKVPYEALFIDDKNDGGCKSDKFERDVRLLTEEIKDNPRNDRAHYYLGQSLKDLQRFEEAIAMFTKRIELGGWVEEVWYSHYQIGKCYHHMNRPHDMELWMNKAFEYRPCRAEPLYHLTKYYREVSQHYKAYHYYLKGRGIPYPKDDVLFIEEHVYSGLFDYENTILACYVNGRSKQDALYDVVTYLNKGTPHFVHNVWDNLHYYVEPLTSIYHGKYSRLLLPDHEEYKVSSCCLVPWSNEDNKRFLLNTRYVNYSIDEHGTYHMRSADGHVKTKNGYTYLNSSYFPTENITIMTEHFDKHDSNIEGLEDVRVFKHNGAYFCTASSKNVSPSGNIEMTLSHYFPQQNMISNVAIIQPPRPSGCEKNWIYVPNMYVENTSANASDTFNFIYGWNPLEIGAVENNKLTIHTTQNTPPIFNRFRGSSPLVEHGGKLYCVVHFVRYSTPRVYYHSVVQFSRTMRVEAFAVPFCFRQTKIEYCLGFHINDEQACFIFSENDTCPGLITVPFKNLRMVPI